MLDPGLTPQENASEEEAPVCASGATVKGIDVSYFQGTINWTAVKQSGIDFAFARVSDGTGFIDPQFAANWANMKAAGVVRGAYQFFRPETDPTAQANLLVAQIKAAGGLASGDLAPTIDVEVTDNVAVSTILSRIQTWLNVVQTATGLTPTIYVSPGFWSTLGNPTAFSKYALWVANWNVSCPSIPSSTWSTWRFWQYADTGTVPGVGSDPDLDEFNGSLAALLAFAGGKGGSSSGSSSSSSSSSSSGAPPPACTVAGVAGTCIQTTACAAMPGHVSTPGLCPGPASEECCTPPPACAVAGVAGICIQTSVCATLAGHKSTPGFCPGPASEECCTP